MMPRITYVIFLASVFGLVSSVKEAVTSGQEVAAACEGPTGNEKDPIEEKYMSIFSYYYLSHFYTKRVDNYILMNSERICDMNQVVQQMRLDKASRFLNVDAKLHDRLFQEIELFSRVFTPTKGILKTKDAKTGTELINGKDASYWSEVFDLIARKASNAAKTDEPVTSFQDTSALQRYCKIEGQVLALFGEVHNCEHGYVYGRIAPKDTSWLSSMKDAFTNMQSYADLKKMFSAGALKHMVNFDEIKKRLIFFKEDHLADLNKKNGTVGQYSSPLDAIGVMLDEACKNPSANEEQLIRLVVDLLVALPFDTELCKWSQSFRRDVEQVCGASVYAKSKGLELMNHIIGFLKTFVFMRDSQQASEL